MKDHNFKIGYIVCEQCENNQHKKYDKCKQCGATIGGN